LKPNNPIGPNPSQPPLVRGGADADLPPVKPEPAWAKPQRTTFPLRDLWLAAAFTLLMLGIKYLLPADWQWIYKTLGVPAAWIVGIVLVRYTWEHLWLGVGFIFLNFAVGIAPGDAAAIWPALSGYGLAQFFVMSVALLIPSFIGAVIMGFVRALLTISFASFHELSQAFRQAQRENVASAFLRELAHSRHVWFNFAGCLPPLIAPLLIASWGTLAAYLCFAQSLLLYAASRLWLQKEKRVEVVTVLLLHGLPLILVLFALPERQDRLLMGLALALAGIFTADLLRRCV